MTDKAWRDLRCAVVAQLWEGWAEGGFHNHKCVDVVGIIADGVVEAIKRHLGPGEVAVRLMANGEQAPVCGTCRLTFSVGTHCCRHVLETLVQAEKRDDLVKALIGYWDALDTVPSDDERPTELFKQEMDRRIDALRADVGWAHPTNEDV